MTVFYRRILILIFIALFTGCSIAPVIGTPNPTLVPVSSDTPTLFPTLLPARSNTPIPLSTFLPAPLETSIPSRSPTPTLTVTPYILTTLRPTRSPTPTMKPTNTTPCELDFGCVISNDGKWAADGYGKWFPGGISAKDLPFLRIYRADGTIVQEIFCREKGAFGNLMYTPYKFDRSNQWLFATLRFDGWWDGFNFIVPSYQGFVKVNIQTGQVVPMLGIGIYYYSVSFSPDESLFVYTMDKAFGILNMKSAQRSLIAWKYKAASHIAWKPDGTRFLVAASMDGDVTKNWDILLITPGDSQPVQLLDSLPDYSKISDYMNNKSW